MRKIQPDAMAAAGQLAVQEAGDWLAALTLREGATPPSLLAKMRADAAARRAFGNERWPKDSHAD